KKYQNYSNFNKTKQQQDTYDSKNDRHAILKMTPLKLAEEALEWTTSMIRPEKMTPTTKKHWKDDPPVKEAMK
ncbi:17543_t:CDS:2, partial [Gigaspora margarita]